MATLKQITAAKGVQGLKDLGGVVVTDQTILSQLNVVRTGPTLRKVDRENIDAQHQGSSRTFPPEYVPPCRQYRFLKSFPGNVFVRHGNSKKWFQFTLDQ